MNITEQPEFLGWDNAQDFTPHIINDAQSKPYVLGLSKDTTFQIKIDCAFCIQGALFIGGWVSHNCTLSICVEGVDHESVLFSRFVRPDVNTHLQSSSDEKHGFSCVANFNSLHSVHLVVLGEEFKLKININTDDVFNFSYDELSLIVGEESLQKILMAWSDINSYQRVHGALDSIVSYHQGKGITVFIGWLANPTDLPIWVEDSSGEKYEFCSTYFWFRKDIVDIFDDVCGQNNGHSFIAYVDTHFGDGEKITMFALSGRLKQKICSNNAVLLNTNFKSFLKHVFSINVPWHELVFMFDKIHYQFLKEIYADRIKLVSEYPYAEGSIGNVLDNPTSSIIIPLYGNLNFIESQFMCFSEDLNLCKNTEVIFVIDDPNILERFVIKIDEIFQLYKVPVRWIGGKANIGFSGANNLGASIAKGRYLAFLNSDVFPQKAGWLEKLISNFNKYSDVGAVGCKLLYADGSIQHASMSFRYREALKIWTNYHPTAGCAPSLDMFTDSTIVPAVTGACVIIMREDFDAVGGWSLDYIVGDFEDSDLCLKIRSLGKNVVYDPSVCLTHLERQTFSLLGEASYRQRLTIYNALTHQRKWMPLLKQDFPYRALPHKEK